jgi:lipopolysaccharide/colanic/teichoic acid biosynthesis glycosyltransferase
VQPAEHALLGPPPQHPWIIPEYTVRGLWLKHCFDSVLAVLALVLLSPLLIVLAVVVKMSSPGPVFFRQERIGLNGRPFLMLKFRSMKQGPVLLPFEPSPGVAPGGLEGDDRRTRLGRWLRASSVDELPQLINVVRGEMSLIGPRPERPRYVERFCEEVPCYCHRLRVRPGMTGLAQVRGFRGATSLPKRVDADNEYIESWSIWLDLKVLLLTVRTVIGFLRSHAEDEPARPAVTLVGRAQALPAFGGGDVHVERRAIAVFPSLLPDDQELETAPARTSS